jgi:prepilin-type N-terminal cleavage/methylation domain-containing protein
MKNYGFTLIELLVTVGLFAFLAALSGFILINAQATPRFETSQNQLIATIRQAQTLAMGGDKANQSTAQNFGVHFESNSYTLFKGTIYPEDDDYNLTTQLSGVTLSTIDVPSGNIVFEKTSGEVVDWDENNNSVVLSDDEGNSVTLTINALGVVGY